ncbi:MAG: hypothetical protein RR633_15035 [Acinetobacter sp.]
MWPQIIFFIVSLIISYALQPKPQKPKPAAFEDFEFPTFDDGTPQIVVFGDCWITDWTVIGTGNFANEPIVAKQSGLFGSTKTTTGYKYYMGLHMGLCRGIDDIIEIKIGDKTAWTGSIANVDSIFINQPELFGGEKQEGGILGDLIIQRGLETQSVLPELQTLYKSTNIPAFRGVTTLFFDGMICANSPYPKAWSFRVRRVLENWDTTIWYPEKAVIWLEDNKIKAMNPAHIIYEAQTNAIWGRGFAASQLDLVSFKSAADQLYAEGFGVCLAWKRQDTLTSFIQQVVDNIGGAIYLDRTTGLWKLVLIRSNYDVNQLTAYDFANGLLKIEEDNNASSDIASNLVAVTYRDPITNQDQTIYADNIASINKYGVISESKSYVGIPTATLAGRIASRDMKIAQSGLKRFKLVFDRRAFSMQPLAVFKLSIPDQGIDSIIVRAMRIEHDSISNGQITVTVLQDVFGLPTTSYIAPQASLHQPANYTAQQLSVGTFNLFSMHLYDMCSQFENFDLRQWSVDSAANWGLVAKAPTPLHLNFKLWLRYIYFNSSFNRLDEITYSSQASEGTFAITATFTVDCKASYQPTTAVINIKRTDLMKVSVGKAALIENGDTGIFEVIRIIETDIENSSITFARGCVETIPETHTAELATIWFYEDAIAISKTTFIDRTSGVGRNDVQFLAQTFTKYDYTPEIEDLGGFVRPYSESQDQLGSLGSVSPGPGRNVFVYPVAYVLYNNKEPFNTPYLQKCLEKISWLNRNQFLQLGNLYDQQSASTVYVEEGYVVEVTINYFKNNGDTFETIHHTLLNGTDTELSISNVFPELQQARKAHVFVYMVDENRRLRSKTHKAVFEFYGFGVNFGNFFGGLANGE